MYVDLGRLRSFKGSQRYPIPAGVNLKEYPSVIIWCERFGVLISPADLTTAQAAQVDRTGLHNSSRPGMTEPCSNYSSPRLPIFTAELLLIAAMALIASVVGGVAGYGTGALMPLVLVPVLGPEPVVPIIAISALFNNTWRRSPSTWSTGGARCWSRSWRRRPARGRLGYTMLTGKGARS